MKIGIVGLGLIGGSMAKALAGKHTVYGADLRPEVLKEAQDACVISAVLDGNTLGACELVMLALFPQQAARYAQEHAAQFQKGAVVMDLCGVKRAVEEIGVMGAFTGGLTSTSAGIAAAIFFGALAALICKPRPK